MTQDAESVAYEYVRCHWYAGDSWTIQQRLIAKAQKDANRTGDRELVHAHGGDESCSPDCVLVVPTNVLLINGTENARFLPGGDEGDCRGLAT